MAVEKDSHRKSLRKGWYFLMIKIENHLGTIAMTDSYLTSLIGHAATSCFGVVRMSPVGARQGVKTNLLGLGGIDNGVRIYTPAKKDHENQNKMSIDLHICVTYGINVNAIVDSIVNKVRYVVESETGIEVKKINVYVDGMES